MWVFFSKIVRECSGFINLTRITATLHEDQYTFLIISRSFLFRMGNISDKSRRKYQNAHFVFCKLLFENLAAYDIMWKNSVRDGQITDDKKKKTHSIFLYNFYPKHFSLQLMYSELQDMWRNTCEASSRKMPVTFFFRFWQKQEFVNNVYCSFSVQNCIKLRSAVFEFLHVTGQADNNGRVKTCVFF